MADYPRTTRLDPASAVARIAAAGGPVLDVVGPLVGGSVGAAIVRWPDGHESVLKLLGATPELGPPDLDGATGLMDAARAAGVPGPAYESVFALEDGSVAIIQERASGIVPETVGDALVERMLELARLRVGGVPTALRVASSPLYLMHDGPGFCLHGPLRDHDARTRDLLARIEAIGAGIDDAAGDDIVHFDYHAGNVLVAEDDPDEIVAVVDWGGVRAASIGLDLVILAFDLAWRSDRLSAVVEAELRGLVSDAQFLALWAHAALRLVDWSIRHYPDDVDHWVNFSNRRL